MDELDARIAFHNRLELIAAGRQRRVVGRSAEGCHVGLESAGFGGEGSKARTDEIGDGG
ncbi:hypothetical protein D3C77_754890 [compost metagenome]